MIFHQVFNRIFSSIFLGCLYTQLTPSQKLKYMKKDVKKKLIHDIELPWSSTVLKAANTVTIYEKNNSHHCSGSGLVSKKKIYSQYLRTQNQFDFFHVLPVHHMASWLSYKNKIPPQKVILNGVEWKR